MTSTKIFSRLIVAVICLVASACGSPEVPFTSPIQGSWLEVERNGVAVENGDAVAYRFSAKGKGQRELVVNGNLVHDRLKWRVWVSDADKDMLEITIYSVKTTYQYIIAVDEGVWYLTLSDVSSGDVIKFKAV